MQQARNRNAFDAAEIAAIAGTVVPAMTLLRAGAKAIGITGGVLGLGAATVANYGQYALLLRYDAELQDLVHDAQASYKSKVANDHSRAPLAVAQAYDIIEGYVWLCTLPGIDSLARKALGTARTTTVAIPPPTPLQIAALATIARNLGLPADRLTVDKAAALLVFASNPSAQAASDNARAKLTDTELKTVFNTAGTLLTLKSPEKFSAAIELLRQLRAVTLALDKAVQDQSKTLTAGAVSSPPSLGAGRPESMMGLPSSPLLPETVIEQPSLGVIRPRIEIVR